MIYLITGITWGGMDNFKVKSILRSNPKKHEEKRLLELACIS